MRMLLLKNSRLLLLTIATTVLLFSTGGSAKRNAGEGLDQSRRRDAPQPQPQKIDADAELKRALFSTDIAAVTFELQDEPVAVHQIKTAPEGGIERAALLANPEATAYESLLAVQQENFKTLARQVSPSMRVITELRTLLNAITIEASGTELAVIATLPGVKSVQLT